MWFLNKHLPWINAASTSRTSVVAHLFLCLFICPFCCSFLFCFVLLVVCLFVFKLTNSISYSVNSAKESATFWIRFPERKFLNTLWIRNCVDTKSGFFFYLVMNILYSRWQPRSQALSRRSKMQISRALRRRLCCQYSQRSPGY